MRESNKGNAVSGGVGFTGLLTIAFVILKLVGVIDWKWFWVLSPSIFGIGLAIICFLIAIILSIIISILDKKERN